MKKHIRLLATILLAWGTALGADATDGAHLKGTDAFSRLKSLVGEWEGRTDTGSVHLSYELIAGGTALVERFTSEKEPAMLTVYHMDGSRLLLEHYCMAGNQPRMEAVAFQPETGEITFRFVSATNLASPGQGHMHNAKMRIGDANHLVADWQFYENGGAKFSEKVEYTRLK